MKKIKKVSAGSSSPYTIKTNLDGKIIIDNNCENNSRVKDNNYDNSVNASLFFINKKSENKLNYNLILIHQNTRKIK